MYFLKIAGHGVIAAGAVAAGAGVVAQTTDALAWSNVVDNLVGAAIILTGTVVTLYFKDRADRRRDDFAHALRIAQLEAIHGNTRITQQAADKADVAAVKADEAARVVVDGLRGTVDDTNTVVHEIDRKVTT